MPTRLIMPDLSSPASSGTDTLSRVLGWFIPDGERDRVALLRAQLYVVLSFLIAANAGLFAVLHAVHHVAGTPETVIWILVAMCGISLSLPLLLRWGVPMPVLNALFVAVLEVGVIGIACFDGGLRSGAMFWMVVAPLAAAFLGGSRTGWTAALVSISAGVAIYAAMALGHVFPVSLSPIDAAQHYAINFACGVAFVAALSALYEGPMVRHFRDLSGRLHAANEDLRRELVDRQRVQAQAEAASRAKDVLLANMSHEFRTPLTSILGFTEILVEEVPDDHRPFLESIDRGGRRLLNTLNGVLDLAWIESGETALAVTPLDASAVVAETASRFLPTALQRGLTFEVHGSEALVLADGDALRRVLAALIDNAIRFTEHGEVTVWVETVDDETVVSVSDTGLGMLPEFLDEASQPFRQASEGDARTHEGVGVGLTIARRLVEMMGGRFEIESVYGEGTTVRLRLPVFAGPHVPTADRVAVAA